MYLFVCLGDPWAGPGDLREADQRVSGGKSPNKPTKMKMGNFTFRNFKLSETQVVGFPIFQVFKIQNSKFVQKSLNTDRRPCFPDLW